MLKKLFTVFTILLGTAGYSYAAVDLSDYRVATYGPTTHYCDLAKAGTGVGTPADPWNATQCMTQPVAGNVVGILPGVSIPVSTAACVNNIHMAAFQPTNSGTALAPIVYVTKYPAIALANVETNPNRTEFRHNGAPPTIRADGSGNPQDSGCAMLGGFQKNYIKYDGFYIDLSHAWLKEDSGVLRPEESTGQEFRNFVIKGANMTTCASNCVMYRPQNVINTVLSNFYAYGCHNNAPASASPQECIFNDSYGDQNFVIEKFRIRDFGHGLLPKGTANGSVFNSGVIRDGRVYDISNGCVQINAVESTSSIRVHHVLCYNWGLYGVQLGIVDVTRNVILDHLTIVAGTGCDTLNCSGPIYLRGPAPPIGTGNIVRDNILIWNNQSFSAGFFAEDENEALSPGFTVNYNAYYNSSGVYRWKWNGNTYTSLSAWSSATSLDTPNSRVLTDSPFNVGTNVYTVQNGHVTKTASSTGGELGAFEGGYLVDYDTTPTVSSPLIPASRLVISNWSSAGVTPNGGIPARTTICSTLNASTYGNGATDATSAINAAITACPAGQTVSLSAGLFRIEGYIMVNKGITLRGQGAGITILENPNGALRSETLDIANGNDTGIIIVGLSQFPHFLNTGVKTLTANGAQGSSTVTLDNVTGLSVGQYILISEDHYNTATWASKPLSGGVANKYQVLASDKVIWAKHRNILTAAVTSVTSNATTDQITTNTNHGLTSGDLVYFNGHSGTFAPSASDNVYRVRDIVSPTVFTLQPASWDGSLVNITVGSTSGTIESTRPGDNLNPGPVDPTNSALGWFSRGYGHVYGEIKRITAINSNTLTFESPLTDDYRTAYSAQVSVSDTGFVENAGVENLTLHRGARGGIQFLNAAKSWTKGVDNYEYYDPGIKISTSYRIEVIQFVSRYSAWGYPGGGAYALQLANQSSECLIWDSVFIDANKVITANAVGGGNVFAYNYVDDGHINNYLTWQEVGINGGHFPGSHHMLFEGNLSWNADNDYTHGSTVTHTFVRNWLTGQRTGRTDVDNVRTIGMAYGSLNMSFVGNVLGVSGQMSSWTIEADGSDGFIGDTKNIYKLGYDPVEMQQNSDPNVVSTFIDKDNYNYLTNSIRVSGTPNTVPNSYFLSVKPTFFGSCTWPWVDATGTTKTSTLPAKYRYDNGSVTNSSVDPCAGAPVTPTIGTGNGMGGLSAIKRIS